MNNKWFAGASVSLICISIGMTNVYALADKTNAEQLPEPVVQQDQHDPYEGFNRIVFDFNERVDIAVARPVATFYNTIMPRPLNQGIHNFFVNIGNLPVIANDLLQANFRQAGSDLWRLGINSTIGIAGFFDIADRMQLKPYNNDFGLTLARWGYKNSNYLVLPFFGPNTIRDGIGIPVDYFAFSIYPYINPESARYELYSLGVLDKRAQLLQYQDVIEEASLDKYVFVRNAYMQRRAYQMELNANGGNPLPEKSTESNSTNSKGYA